MLLSNLSDFTLLSDLFVKRQVLFAYAKTDLHWKIPNGSNVRSAVIGPPCDESLILADSEDEQRVAGVESSVLSAARARF